MRVLAWSTALSLLSPPIPAEPPAEPEPALPAEAEAEREPEPELEDEDDPFADAGTAESAAEAAAQAEALRRTAEGLANGGRCREAIPVYHQAYALAPDEHLIAYEIASCAAELGDCQTMRVYLAHFVTHADPAVFPNKLAKAERALSGETVGACRPPSGSRNSEVLEARDAGGRRGSPGLASARPDGSGLVGGGIVMVGVGVLGFVAGVAMVGVGLHRTRTAATSLDIEDIERARNLTIAGSVVGPAGVVLVVGGSIMVARGNSPAYVRLGPGALTLRF